MILRAKSLRCLLLGIAVMAAPGEADSGASESDLGRTRVAVASNFLRAARELAALFEETHGSGIVLASGSTGKHYAQIRNGARFDLFLAADVERPRRLESEGLAVSGSRFTYARGRLVLWASEGGPAIDDLDALAVAPFRHLAIAQPELAPYGRAAREALERRDLWPGVRARLVRGENIGQAFQFVASGNAELGLVARSQVIAIGADQSTWSLVPEALHTPIDQQAVLLRDRPVARDFLRFLRGDAARRVIVAHGYETP